MSLNNYTYGLSNPVRFPDPTGLYVGAVIDDGGDGGVRPSTSTAGGGGNGRTPTPSTAGGGGGRGSVAGYVPVQEPRDFNLFDWKATGGNFFRQMWYPGGARQGRQTAENVETGIEVAHFVGDVCGVFGIQLCDLANAILYFVEKRNAMAAISLAGAVPIAGEVAVGAKPASEAPKATKAARTLDGTVNALKRAPGGTRAEVPILEIDATRMPNIADNIQSAIDAGHPNVLYRITDQDAIRANRAAVCRGFCAKGSPDEYPFACSQQGGAGARVSGVPLREQRFQGGVLVQFYKKHNIGDGDAFEVVVRGSAR